MSGHDQGLSLLLLPEHGGGQVDRVERTQWSRKRERGPCQDSSRGFHQLELLGEPEDRLPAGCEISVTDASLVLQPIQRTQALDFDECAGHAVPDLAPIRQSIVLSDDDAKRTDESR